MDVTSISALPLRCQSRISISIEWERVSEKGHHIGGWRKWMAKGKESNSTGHRLDRRLRARLRLIRPVGDVDVGLLLRTFCFVDPQLALPYNPYRSSLANSC